MFIMYPGSFVPPEERLDTLRSFILISVPIFVPRGNDQAKNAAKTIVRTTFAKAISSGNFNGF
jgi:hypothetical protein